MDNQFTLTRPRAVIFDTDNTLYPYEPAHKAATVAVEDKAIALLGVNREIFRNACEEAKISVKAMLKGTASSHSRLLYFQKTIELLGMRTRILMTLDLEQTYWRIFLANCRLFTGVKDFVIELKNAGIITANITDLTAQIQFRKMIYFGLDEYFDYVVTSEEAGKDKPDRRAFELALGKLDVEPSSIWMIGDDLNSDMRGAAHFGMIKVQKIHKGVSVDRDGIGKPDMVFREYRELQKIFGGLRFK